MHIEVDRSVCTGHGRCWTLAPEVYEADDDGFCATGSVEVPAGLEPQALRGANSCPERAITAIQE